MANQNDIEGEVLSAIDAVFGDSWWKYLCDETQEEIRDNLSSVWDKFFPASQNSDNSEAVEQPLTKVKTPPPATPGGEIKPQCISCLGANHCGAIEGGDICKRHYTPV